MYDRIRYGRFPLTLYVGIRIFVTMKPPEPLCFSVTIHLLITGRSLHYKKKAYSFPNMPPDFPDVLSLLLYVLQRLSDLCLYLIAELHVVAKQLLDSLASLCELAFSITEP